jgi:hypothetical protein
VKLETVWVVTDPGPLSEFGDICFESTPVKLCYWATGASLVLSYAERITTVALYTIEAEARADAEARLRARDGRTG